MDLCLKACKVMKLEWNWEFALEFHSGDFCLLLQHLREIYCSFSQDLEQ